MPSDAEINPYKEQLPDQCPPSDACSLVSSELIRLIGPHDIIDEDFYSHAALGLPCTSTDKACEWASCSMFLTSYEKHRLLGLLKFKRLKHKNAVAYVAVNADAGVARVSASKHVDLWMYSGYNPLDNIQKVVSLSDYKAT